MITGRLSVNTELGGHGSDVHEESIRIPLAFLYPGFRSAEEYDGLVGEMDLPPTVAHLMGFQMRGQLAAESVSFLRKRPNRRLYHYAEGRDAMVGYREGDEKVILRMPQPALIDLLPWATPTRSNFRAVRLASRSRRAEQPQNKGWSAKHTRDEPLIALGGGRKQTPVRRAPSRSRPKKLSRSGKEIWSHPAAVVRFPPIADMRRP